MKTNLRIIVSAICLAFSALSNSVMAGAEAYAMPQENRLVQFQYDANRTYDVMTRPGALTDIALDPNENLVALGVGDTVQWITADTAGHVFVKPLRPNLFTTATIVTDKRTYQISLRSSPEGGLFYQRVSWVYPDFLIIKERKPASADAIAPKPKSSDSESDAGSIGLSMAKLDDMNFDYDVSGSDVQFKPTQVWDDGKFVWLQMPRNSQEQPALFIKTEDGLALANYTTKGRYLVIQQLFSEAVLKVGSEEVQITKRGKWWN